jgi:hypothetical protein
MSRESAAMLVDEQFAPEAVVQTNEYALAILAGCC